MDKVKTAQANDINLIPKTTTVPEAVDGFGIGLKNVILKIDEVLANGWNPIDDIPPVLGTVVQELSSKFQAWKQVALEGTQAPYATARSITINVTEAVEEVVK